MSKTTTVNALPYPEDTDAPDGPAQIKALAEALDVLKLGSRNLKPTIAVSRSSAAVSLGTGTESLLHQTSVACAVPSIAVVVASIYLTAAPTKWKASLARYLGGLQEEQGGVVVEEKNPAAPPLFGIFTLAEAGPHAIRLSGQRTEGSGGEIPKGGAQILTAVFAS